MDDKRALVVDEILSTERSYVKNLRIVIEVFDKPLRQLEQSGKGKILDTAELHALFANLEEIFVVNEELERNLKEARKSDNVGECMCKVIPFLKV